ncbi:type II toxin-antitoxin system prevent-host-death family antitoxin [Lentzea alba]|uniref:type II toxin-antitoxin system Phd/YefM family antitoxin n=1 Tax=Lentzea alba TaxID=2714351 RepID=UPI0039BF18D1
MQNEVHDRPSRSSRADRHRATKLGVAGLVADAEQGGPVMITRHSRPVAAVVPMSRLAEIDEAAADLRDLALVLARSVADSGRRASLDDVLETFGHTRESLAAVEDEDSLDG